MWRSTGCPTAPTPSQQPSSSECSGWQRRRGRGGGGGGGRVCWVRVVVFIAVLDVMLCVAVLAHGIE